MMSNRYKLTIKRLVYPGFNLGTRSRLCVSRYFISEDKIRTLDIGCGNGCFTSLAAQRGGTAIGVSFDAGQISRCREFFESGKTSGGRLEFKVMSAEEIAAMDERFDQILLLEVIEHIENDRQVLANIFKLLKPNGLLHITTPDITLGDWVGVIDRKAMGGHCRLGYSAARLEFIMRSVGLDIAFCGRVGSWGDYLAPMQIRILRLLGGGFLAQGLAFGFVYPLYWILRALPIPGSLRIFQHLIARKSDNCSES